MKINSYCIDCNKEIKHYNIAKRCVDCWNKFRRIGAKWLIKYCVDCGIELKNKQAKLCKKCYGLKRQKHYYCQDCNKEISYSYNKRCSKCASKGVLNPSYIDGRSSIEYGHEFNYSLRRLIKIRDNYTCLICKTTESEHIEKYKKGLEVHHRDTNKRNNDINNLTTLCVRCHRIIHNEILKVYRNKN